jgi:tRNA pseudouridine(55) synthase
MNTSIEIINKSSGITMNQLIKKYIEDNNVSRNETISKVCFAGRLDPMARGQVLLLLNDECKKIDNYKHLNKTYQFEIILGIQTTSDDPLGIIQNIKNIESSDLIKLKNLILDTSYPYPKTFYQKFHHYSSKCINGKPLWYYSKNNIEIDLPTHEVSIYDFKMFDIKKYNSHEWKKLIIEQIKTIDSSCDFNQSIIIDQWTNLEMNEYIYSIPCEIKVSGGFYVRQFVHDLINITKTPLLTYDINRIQIEINV